MPTGFKPPLKLDHWIFSTQVPVATIIKLDPVATLYDTQRNVAHCTPQLLNSTAYIVAQWWHAGGEGYQ